MRIKYLYILLVLVYLLPSCSPDAMSPLDETFGVAAKLTKDADNRIVFITDDNSLLVPNYELKEDEQLLGKRFFVEFTITEQFDSMYRVSLIGYQQMYEQEIINYNDTSELSQYADDPIEISWLWKSENYINIVAYLNTDDAMQNSYLLLKENNKEASDTINMHLKVENKNMNISKYKRVAISYKMEDLQPQKYILFSYKNADGEVYTIEMQNNDI